MNQSSSLSSSPRGALWEGISEAQWNDWQWQQANRVTSVQELAELVELSEDEWRAIEAADERFRFAITPYYASLMDRHDRSCPIRRQAVPVEEELRVSAEELLDPLGEEASMPVPGITHRYPDRVLFYTSHNCPVYCRHCNRKRKVGDPTSAAHKEQLRQGIEYIRAHPEIRDVLVSGGDPLTFSDHRLEEILRDLRAIPHLEIIRIATRNPVTLPQRITAEFAEMLKRYHPIYVNTHFNHLKECTPEAALALERLADAGCVVGNQMVLLKGINDDAEMVRAMNQWLQRRRCRPYYIFQLDPAEGTTHFRTPIESGLELLRGLRGWTTGMAVPHYVVDLPRGGGKVPVQPDYLVAREGRTYTFKNYAGEEYTYIEGVGE
ncbi:MAG: KamA family radical SAM protein [Myxococcota bacterium]|nr:KamA family radical SAM protein [Myxococcota bacterium]